LAADIEELWPNHDHQQQSSTSTSHNKRRDGGSLYMRAQQDHSMQHVNPERLRVLNMQQVRYVLVMFYNLLLFSANA
jgi:hypothetical protein